MPSQIPGTINPAEIGDLGSNYAYGKIVTDFAGTGTDTFAGLPMREKFGLTPSITVKSATMEDGTEYTIGTTVKWTMKYVTKQISKIVLQSLPDAVDGKIVLFVLELNAKPINGKRLYAACLGKMTKRPSIESGTSPEFEFTLSPASADITLALDAATFPKFGATFTSSSIVIPKDSYVGVLEV
jgi:hypothetical protein